MNIRKARMDDIKAIHYLLGYYANKGLLLPRSLSELYEHLRDFYIVEDDSTKHEVIGVCGLGICWENLAEIKSLAVEETHQHSGFAAGRDLYSRGERVGSKKNLCFDLCTGFFRDHGI